MVEQGPGFDSMPLPTRGAGAGAGEHAVTVDAASLTGEGRFKTELLRTASGGRCAEAWRAAAAGAAIDASGAHG